MLIKVVGYIKNDKCYKVSSFIMLDDIEFVTKIEDSLYYKVNNMYIVDPEENNLLRHWISDKRIKLF